MLRAWLEQARRRRLRRGMRGTRLEGTILAHVGRGRSSRSATAQMPSWWFWMGKAALVARPFILLIRQRWISSRRTRALVARLRVPSASPFFQASSACFTKLRMRSYWSWRLFWMSSGIASMR